MRDNTVIVAMRQAHSPSEETPKPEEKHVSTQDVMVRMLQGLGSLARHSLLLPAHKAADCAVDAMAAFSRAVFAERAGATPGPGTSTLSTSIKERSTASSAPLASPKPRLASAGEVLAFCLRQLRSVQQLVQAAEDRHDSESAESEEVPRSYSGARVPSQLREVLPLWSRGDVTVSATRLGGSTRAEVLLGTTSQGQPVAVKRLHTHSGDTAEQVWRLFREALVMAGRRHLHCLPLLGIVAHVPSSTTTGGSSSTMSSASAHDQGTFLCLITRYLPGGSLDDALASPSISVALTPRHRLAVAVRVATALSALHEPEGSDLRLPSSKPQAVVHGAVRASHVLLGSSSSVQGLLSGSVDVMLGGFGSASLTQDAGDAPGASQGDASGEESRPAGRKRGLSAALPEALAFTPPEMLQAGAVADTPSDVWAFGCFLVELITGEPPHADAAGVAEVLKRLSLGQPPQVSRRALAQYPSAIAGVLAGCLQPVPQDRWSMQTVVHELHAILSGAAQARRPAGVPPRSRPPSTRVQVDTSSPAVHPQHASPSVYMTSLRRAGTTELADLDAAAFRSSSFGPGSAQHMLHGASHERDEAAGPSLRSPLTQAGPRRAYRPLMVDTHSGQQAQLLAAAGASTSSDSGSSDEEAEAVDVFTALDATPVASAKAPMGTSSSAMRLVRSVLELGGSFKSGRRVGGEAPASSRYRLAAAAGSGTPLAKIKSFHLQQAAMVLSSSTRNLLRAPSLLSMSMGVPTGALVAGEEEDNAAQFTPMILAAVDAMTRPMHLVRALWHALGVSRPAAFMRTVRQQARARGRSTFTYPTQDTTLDPRVIIHIVRRIGELLAMRKLSVGEWTVEDAQVALGGGDAGRRGGATPLAPPLGSGSAQEQVGDSEDTPSTPATPALRRHASAGDMQRPLSADSSSRSDGLAVLVPAPAGTQQAQVRHESSAVSPSGVLTVEAPAALPRPATFHVRRSKAQERYAFVPPAAVLPLHAPADSIAAGEAMGGEWAPRMQLPAPSAPVQLLAGGVAEALALCMCQLGRVSEETARWACFTVRVLCDHSAELHGRERSALQSLEHRLSAAGVDAALISALTTWGDRSDGVVINAAHALARLQSAVQHVRSLVLASDAPRMLLRAISVTSEQVQGGGPTGGSPGPDLRDPTAATAIPPGDLMAAEVVHAAAAALHDAARPTAADPEPAAVKALGEGACSVVVSAIWRLCVRCRQLRWGLEALSRRMQQTAQLPPDGITGSGRTVGQRFAVQRHHQRQATALVATLMDGLGETTSLLAMLAQHAPHIEVLLQQGAANALCLTLQAGALTSPTLAASTCRAITALVARDLHHAGPAWTRDAFRGVHSATPPPASTTDPGSAFTPAVLRMREALAAGAARSDLHLQDASLGRPSRKAGQRGQAPVPGSVIDDSKPDGGWGDSRLRGMGSSLSLEGSALSLGRGRGLSDASLPPVPLTPGQAVVAAQAALASVSVPELLCLVLEDMGLQDASGHVAAAVTVALYWLAFDCAAVQNVLMQQHLHMLIANTHAMLTVHSPAEHTLFEYGSCLATLLRNSPWAMASVGCCGGGSASCSIM